MVVVWWWCRCSHSDNRITFCWLVWRSWVFLSQISLIHWLYFICIIGCGFIRHRDWLRSAWSALDFVVDNWLLWCAVAPYFGRVKMFILSRCYPITWVKPNSIICECKLQCTVLWNTTQFLICWDFLNVTYYFTLVCKSSRIVLSFPMLPTWYLSLFAATYVTVIHASIISSLHIDELET